MTFDSDDRKRRPKIKLSFDSGKEGDDLQLKQILIGVGNEWEKAKEGESVRVSVTHLGFDDRPTYDADQIKMCASSPVFKDKESSKGYF
jgi:hypothetical protein